MDAAIRLQNLVKQYDDVVAVAGLDLEVRRGECFGLLGPNGAGKTTTVEIMEGLTPPTSGLVEVLGLRWDKNGDELRARIGVTLQETKLFEKLTVEETLRLFRTFYDPKRARDVETVLREMQLGEKRKAWVQKLSGGQRQRLAVALGVMGDPDILFLDEPTTGLDPQSRRALWDTISALRARGKTVVLTTHYMDEAEFLCDRVAVVDHGKLIALGSPAQLIDDIGGHHLVELSTDVPLPPEAVADVAGVRSARAAADGLALSIGEPHVALPALFTRLGTRGARPTRLVSRAATLDDVFLSLTGRTLRED
ncbi:MAG TPA: ABC transporter ATP-binding protein [Burkholderiaceae bacterium]|jgi:ABC-2 type transport system ATP-binding protein|nr:ABC transporter ATP-binding protein [Burkholderiaceae bacterium]